MKPCSNLQLYELCSLSVCNQRHLSQLLFLTPHLPGFLIGRRLNSHALELLQLDRALSRLGPHQLSDSELRQVTEHINININQPNALIRKFSCFQACFVRGLDSDSLGINQCREWLSQWLQVSLSLKGFLYLFSLNLFTYCLEICFDFYFYFLQTQKCHCFCTPLYFFQPTIHMAPGGTDRKLSKVSSFEICARHDFQV